MIPIILNAFCILAWLWIGYRVITPKLRRMREAKDEEIKRQHQGDLVQYALVYIMMMLLLAERSIEAIMSL